MSSPITLTTATLRQTVESTPGLLVVDFWAPWCAPCRALAPVIDALARDHGGRVTFAKLNVDENEEAAIEARVSSIPALLFFVDGKLVDRTVGVLPRQILEGKLAQLAPAQTSSGAA